MLNRACRNFILFLLIASTLEGIGSENDNNQPSTILRGNGMMFTENKGQITDTEGHLRSDILYKGQATGTDVYLRRTGFSYVLNHIDGGVEMLEHPEKGRSITLNQHRIDIDFEGCNADAEIVNLEQVEGFDNYYYSYCPQGITQVKSYNQIIVKNIYDNIDVKYYGGGERGLKYDIIIHPGADPSIIKMKYSGADQLEVINGEVQIKNSLRLVTEVLPKVYQTINGEIVDVEAKYKLNESTLSFEFTDYQVQYPLVIDPWITYYGGSDWERSGSVTVDNMGDVIVTGNTWSTDFPILGASQSTYGGGDWDGLVIKFTNAGVRVFATYFGGSSFDYSQGVDTDSGRNIFITGGTNSVDLPTQNPAGGAYFQMNYAGGVTSGSGEAFIAKYTPAGTLTWLTYYGGTNDDVGHDLVVDNADNIILTGMTRSLDLPVMGAYQAGNKGSQDAFVSKFSSAGAMQWATYYGGSLNDESYTIDIDASGDVFIGGFTFSLDFPILLAHQSAMGLGTSADGDGFIAKLSGVTGSPVWSTYYGGNGDFKESVYAVTVDGLGNVYAGGKTRSTDNIYTPGAYQTIVKGVCDAFIVKFNNAGVRQWATYLGGGADNRGDYVTGLACDKNNNLVVAGDTYCSDFPVTSCSFQTTFASTECQFITTFYPDGTLMCSGMLGRNGNGDKETSSGLGGSVAVYGCYLFLNAFSECRYPVTAGSFQTTCNGELELSIASLYIYNCGGRTNNKLNFTSDLTSVCTGQPVNFIPSYTNYCDTLGLALTYQWSFTGGTPSSSTLKNPIISYSSPGSYRVKLVIGSACKKDSITKNNYITVNSSPLPVITGNSNICLGNSTTLTANGASSYVWSTGETANTIGLNGSSTGIFTYSLIGTNPNGCTGTATTTVTVNPFLPVLINGPDSICQGQMVSLTASGANTYLWNTTNTTVSISDYPLASTIYSVTGTDANGCTGIGTTSVIVNLPPSISIDGDLSICNGNTATLTASGASSYVWSTSQTTASISVSPTMETVYSVLGTDANGCTGIATTTVSVNSLLGVLINGQDSICQGQMVSLTASGANTYLWNTTNTTVSISDYPVISTIYSVIGSDANGCTGIATTTVTVNLPPSITISGPTSICNNDTVTLSAFGGNMYQWNTSQTTTSITIFPTLLTVYSVYGTDINGCSNIAVHNVNVNPLPIVSFSIDDSVSCVPLCIDFVNTSSGSISCLWNFGDGNSSDLNNVQHCYTVPGMYSVTLTVTDANNCSATLNKLNLINVHPNPFADFIMDPKPPLPPNTTVNFIDKSSGANFWQWTFGDVANSSSSLQNTSFNYIESGVYEVTQVVSNSYGCYDTVTFTVYVQDEFNFYLPNAFTPNGDELNDIFSPTGTGIDATRFKMWVFDRWGNLIWHTNQWGMGWDGKANNGKDIAQIDTYVWKIQLNDISGKRHNYIGHVNLVR